AAGGRAQPGRPAQVPAPQTARDRPAHTAPRPESHGRNGTERLSAADPRQQPRSPTMSTTGVTSSSSNAGKPVQSSHKAQGAGERTKEAGAASGATNDLFALLLGMAG